MYRKIVVLLLVVTLTASVFMVPNSFGNNRTVTSTEDALRIRSSVSTQNNDNVLGYAYKGDSFTYLGSTKDSQGKTWYKISYSGKTAYISGEYSSLSPETVDKALGTGEVNANVGLRVRSTPSTSGTTLGYLDYKDKVTYYEEKSGWLRISYNGSDGWVSKEYVTVSSSSSDTREATTPVVTTSAIVTSTDDGVRVRSSVNTSISSNILGFAYKGNTYTYLGYAKDSAGTIWYKITFNGKTGYITSQFSKLTSSDNNNGTGTTGIITASSALRVRSSASSTGSLIGFLTPNSVITYYETKGDWLRITFNGNTGWIHKNFVQVIGSTSTEKGQDGYITANTGLRVRSSASSSGTALGVLSRNSKVTYYEQRGDWLRINYNGRTGWIHKNFVSAQRVPDTEQGTKVYVKANVGVRVRASASSTGSVLGLLSNNSEVTYYEQRGDWLRIIYNGNTAWIHKNFVSSTVTVTPPQESANLTVISNEDALRIRTSVDTSSTSNVLGYASKGNTFSYISSTRDSLGRTWYQISYNGRRAYIIAEYTTLSLDSSSSQTGKTGVVKAQVSLSVRSQADGRSSLIGVLPNNTQITYSEVQGDWLRINYNGQTGWVHRSYIITSSPIDSNTLTDLKIERFPSIGVIALESPITIQAYAQGTTNVEYRFLVNNQVERNYSSQDHVVWVPTQAGTYHIRVDAKENATGKVITRTMSIIVSSTVTSNHYYTVDLLPSTLNDFADRQMAYSSPQTQDAASGWRWRDATKAEVLKELDPLNILGFDYTQNTSGAMGQVTVNYDGYNVRESYSTSSRSLGTLRVGDTFDILGMNNGWYQVNYNGRNAWIYNGGVDFVPVAVDYQPLAETIRLNSGINLNLRDSPDINGQVLLTISTNSNSIYTVREKQNGWYKINHGGVDGWVHGDYVSPAGSEVSSVWFQFLDLSHHTEASADELNRTVLANKGILSGQAAAFIEASKTYEVNEIYLIAHALLETGNGSSTLATGVTYNGVTVYNMYGIGAFDSDPIGGGSRMAYEQGWTTPEKAIIGGAEWIGKRYINNETNDQNTLWKMRWNFDNIYHQYATDVGWARKQTYQMQNMYSQLDHYSFKFIIPQFLPQ